MKKFYLLTKTLLVAVLLCVGANAWAAGYTRTLNDALVVSGYKVKAFYDFQNNDPAVLPTSGDLRYRAYENGGYWGLHNFAAAGRSATATIPVANGDILIIQEYNSSYVTTINRGSENSGLSTSTGYRVFDISSTADDVTFTVPRYGGIVAALVMEEDLTVATPTFTVGSYNYEQGGYAVTPSCATEGATLTYTIGGGSAKACTSGVPFYAKGGKLNITASKDGWTSSSLAEGDQWTLNAAPSSSSPETLIPFQTSNDNGDKNIEHVYKSVTIAGGNSGAIAGIAESTGLKMRTNQSGNTITLNVNPGYIVTKVSMAARSNTTDAEQLISLTGVSVDGGANIIDKTYQFPISSAKTAVEYASSTISASNNIVFTFDNGSASNKQIRATIKVWYKTPVENAIDDCKTYDTSAAFATAIDAESFESVAEVYAFNTAWQVENGTASKAILNNTVTSTDHWWGTLGDDPDYTGAPDTKYLYNTAGSDYNVNQIVYQLPAGVYRASAWTYSSIEGWRKIYVSKVPAEGAWQDLITPYTSNQGWVELSGEFTLTEPANIAFGLYASAISGRVAGFDNWTLTLTGEQVTVSDAGYATYVSSYDLDFTSTSIKAHTAVVNTSTGVVTLNPINKVPAGTPVVLYKEGGLTEIIPLAASTDAVGTNDLVAGTGAAVATGTNPYNYVLDNVSGIGFYKANGVTVATNRAYLQTTYNVAGSGARGMRMVFAGDITGINEAAATAEAAQKDGKFIENGKLVIVKNGKKYNANGTEIK